jgi:hypothetical protein
MFSVAWVVWAILAPEPYIMNYRTLGHISAAVGAVGLISIAAFPQRKMVRFLGTLAAIIYPLHRGLSIAVDPNSFTTIQRRITAVGFSLVVVLSLLVLYPVMWWVAQNRGLDNEE